VCEKKYKDSNDLLRPITEHEWKDGVLPNHEQTKEIVKEDPNIPISHSEWKRREFEILKDRENIERGKKEQ
jgi:hypothetical protein